MTQTPTNPLFEPAHSALDAAMLSPEAREKIKSQLTISSGGKVLITQETLSGGPETQVFSADETSIKVYRSQNDVVAQVAAIEAKAQAPEPGDPPPILSDEEIANGGVVSAERIKSMSMEEYSKIRESNPKALGLK